jgi:hypothetical protein
MFEQLQFYRHASDAKTASRANIERDNLGSLVKNRLLAEAGAMRK